MNTAANCLTSIMIAPLPRSSTLTAVLIAALAIAGCKATNTISSDRPTIPPNAVNVSYKVGNDFLASELRVIDAYEQDRNGLIAVQINVRNEGAGDLWAMWQVEWFDRQGMRIPIEPIIWTREVLAERQFGTIEFVAPSKNAADWRVTLRKWETR